MVTVDPQSEAQAIGWLNATVRQGLERELLPCFLPGQRWFAGKARGLETVRIIDWTVLDGDATLVVVAVSDASGGEDHYFVPLRRIGATCLPCDLEPWQIGAITHEDYEEATLILDGLADPNTSRTLLQLIVSGESIPTVRGAIRGVPTAACAAACGPSDLALTPRYRAIEQSNSALRFGDRLFLKVFRRLMPGVNPDFEIGRFLTERVQFPRVPMMAGAIEYHPEGAEPITLAILQSWVESAGTGWERALAALADYYERTEALIDQSPPIATDRSLLDLTESGEPIPALVRQVIGVELDAAATLGRRTGELHRALASAPDDPSFAPESFTTEDLALVVAEAIAQTDATLDALRRSLDRLNPAVAAEARHVLDGRLALLRHLDALTQLTPDGVKIRIHGDYHLGQVLRTKDDDFFLLDFEGEPSKPLERRRARQSPWKDVVGMLRSFDYAAFAGLFAHCADNPERFERLVPWALAWRTWTSVAFLRSYLENTRASGLTTGDPRFRAALLDALTLDKALYELLYELNHRPAWARIPLQGVVALAERVADCPLATGPEQGTLP